MTSVVIFSFGNYRNIAPYRISNEIRNLGYGCQTIAMVNQFTASEISSLCEKFIDSTTIMIAFSTVFWQPELSESYRTIREVINRLNPQAKVIMGGNRAKEVSQLTPDRVDAIITGQGESLLINYLKSITSSIAMRNPDDIYENIPIYNAEKILTDWDFNNSKTLYVPEDCIFPGEPLVLETSRGCIFRCKFCAFPLNGKKKNDYFRLADPLREELIDTYNKYGVSHYILSDDTFNDSKEKIEYLHSVFTSLPFKLTFTTYARLDLINAHRSQIETLEEMGMIGVHFGIESFHDRAASSIGKGMPGKTSKSFLNDLKTTYWKDRVKVGVSLIQGLPYETIESHAETREWIESEDNLVETVLNFRLGICDPSKSTLPFQSEFQTNASKYGFYWPDNQDPWMWKNMIGPIKSRQEAQNLTDLALASSIKSSRYPGPGSFALSHATSVSPHSKNPKSTEDFMKMSRYEFNAWWKENYNQSYKNYISNYKNALLNL